ncbi:RNA-binding protein [Sulfolobales archaeon HS-7]|nr:RNA-binding protein [Sulfolobales archaeon HS-7]
MTKKAMSYLDLLTWMVINRGRLIGCWIDNVYGTNIEGVFLFKLRCPAGERELIIEPGRRIHFTQTRRDRTSSGSIGILRNLINSTLIKDVTLEEDERIVNLWLSNSLKVVCEIIPRGVLVVTDLEGKIIYLSREIHFKDRDLKIGTTYRLPPKVSPQRPNVSPEEGKKLGLDIKDQKVVNDNVASIISNIKSGQVNICSSKDGNFYVFRIDDCQPIDDFDNFLDNYFSNLEIIEVKRRAQERAGVEKKKIVSTIEELEKRAVEYKDKENELREIAMVIMNNFSTIDQILDDYNKGKIELEHEKNRVIVSINDRKITLDPQKSAYKNASDYFDMAKDFRGKYMKTLQVIEEFQGKLNEIDKVLDETSKKVESTYRRKFWFEKYRWSFTRGGILIIAGRDIDQNESLVRKYLENDDVFLHADLHGAAATIIKSSRKTVSEDEINDAAVISASYSRAWKEGLSSIDVFYVKGEQVSKSPPSGEYLPRGSFMIYGRKNYIKNVRLRLAVCLTKTEGVLLPGVFSEEAAKFHCLNRNYVLIGPGDEQAEKISRRIAKILSKQFEVDINNYISDIQKLLPGNSALLMRQSE